MCLSSPSPDRAVQKASVLLVRVAGLKAPEIFAASGISPEWCMSDPHLFFPFLFGDLPIIRHKLKGINTGLWELQDKSVALRLSTQQVIWGGGSQRDGVRSSDS